MSKKTIGFIGAGNMASALIKGLLKSELYGEDQLAASDKDSEKLKSVSERFGSKDYPSNMELVRESSIIVLAVKPFIIRDVLEEVKDYLRDDHLIISIAAGIPLRMIHSIIERDMPLIRVMPNTPALIQQGVSALAAGKMATPEHMETAREIFEAVGKSVVVTEEMMDAVTAVSGSGPGYVFRIMESFVEAGESLGFDRETALLLVVRTFLGAAQLAAESELSLSQLREMVVTPGGTTAAGITFFEENGLENAIRGGVEAARNKSVELGKEN